LWEKAGFGAKRREIPHTKTAPVAKSVHCFEMDFF
jgi:hypothetical protein